MIITLAEVFESNFKQVRFDSKLAKAIYHYQIKYVNTNREYLDFFGGNLLGVHPIRFKDSDIARLFNDVLDVDFIKLSQDTKTVSAINQEFKVSSDVFNLTIMFLIHKFLTSKQINDKDRQRAAYDSALLFFYRTIAALVADRFKYQSDPKLAQMAYANLSNKYLIKRLGSWHAVMDYRAKDLIDRQGIHYQKLVSFNDDFGIVYAVNDSQGRLRDLFKNYYNELKKVGESGSRIGTTSSVFLDLEGKENIKEKTRSVESYVNYVKELVVDEHSFIKDDLISVIIDINSNTSFRMVKSVLSWLSMNYSHGKYHKDIDLFLTTVVVHSFHLLHNSIHATNLRDYPTLLTKLKNLYLSTRSTDKDLVLIRDLGEKLIKARGEHISESLLLSTRTSIILYITLRALVGINK